MKWLPVLLLLWWTQLAQAQAPLVRVPAGKLNPINASSCWQVDSTGVLPMEAVWRSPAAATLPHPFRMVENLGTSHHAFFQQFRFQAPANSSLYLTVENIIIDTMEVWYTYRGRLVRSKFGGRLPLPQNAAQSANFTLQLSTDGTPQRVLIRYKHDGILVVPSFLSDAEGFYRHNATRYAVEFLLLGILMAMAAYNVVQLFINEKNEYLYYLAYFASAVVFVYLFFFGYALLLPNAIRSWIYDNGYLFAAFFCLLVLAFSKRHIKQMYVPRYMQLMMNLFIGLSVAVLVTCLVAPAPVAIEALELLNTLIVLFHPWYVGSAARKGDRYLHLFFYGSLVISTGITAYTLMLADQLSFNWFTHNYLLPGAFFLEMTCLTLSLAYRSLQERKEKDRLKSTMLQMAEHQKQELEAEVKVQTQALRNAVSELEQTSEVKSKLLSIISHDLRLPFVTLNGTLELLQMGALPPHKVQQKVQHISSSIRQISITLDNLLTWSKSQQQKIRTAAAPVHLPVIADNCTNLLQEPMKGKALALEIEIPDNLYVAADIFQLECIVRNLLSNAIKASPREGRITIKAKRITQSLVRISISDQGKGIEAPSLSELLRTDAELKPYSLSNGLGLQICREFLANHNSFLHYCHDQGNTCFYFDLPYSSIEQVMHV